VWFVLSTNKSSTPHTIVLEVVEGWKVSGRRGSHIAEEVEPKEHLNIEALRQLVVPLPASVLGFLRLIDIC
jgi:hypothetical protein